MVVSCDASKNGAQQDRFFFLKFPVTGVSKVSQTAVASCWHSRFCFAEISRHFLVSCTHVLLYSGVSISSIIDPSRLHLVYTDWTID